MKEEQEEEGEEDEEEKEVGRGRGEVGSEGGRRREFHAISKHFIARRVCADGCT